MAEDKTIEILKNAIVAQLGRAADLYQIEYLSVCKTSAGRGFKSLRWLHFTLSKRYLFIFVFNNISSIVLGCELYE